jgi:hypothetical protein
VVFPKSLLLAGSSFLLRKLFHIQLQAKVWPSCQGLFWVPAFQVCSWLSEGYLTGGDVVSGLLELSKSRNYN